jgi:hypothetical protein
MEEIREAPLIVIVLPEPAVRGTRAETDEAPDGTEMETRDPMEPVVTDMLVAVDG